MARLPTTLARVPAVARTAVAAVAIRRLCSMCFSLVG
jgi:hypothetical protein